MEIKDLTEVDALVDSDSFPFYSSSHARTRRVSMGVIKTNVNESVQALVGEAISAADRAQIAAASADAQVLREELASTSGSGLVALPTGETLAALQAAGGASLIAGAMRVTDSIAALRSLKKTDKATNAFVTGYYAAYDGGGGAYRLDPSDGLSADNGGSIIVATDGGRWKLITSGTVSVKQFGAKGDGVNNDAPAVQLLIDALPAKGGAVFFPPGNYSIGSTIALRNIPMDVYGDGQASRLFGSVNPLIAYPSSVTDASGAVVTQDIHHLTVDATGDNVGIQLHQTWDGAGKVGPNIYANHLLNSSTTTTTAVGISMSGVWAAKIHGNYFHGRGAGGAPTDGKGGFGIHVVLTDDISSSVMNVTILNNIFVTVAYPLHIPNRVVSTGGRVEGIKIIGNNLIAGNVAMRFAQTLAVTITGNQMSDYDVGIMSVADFDMAITGNAEITGKTSGINILAASFGIAERIVIGGNKITCGDSGKAIRLTNTEGASAIRRVSIANNTLSAAGKTDSAGVAVEGSFPVAAVTIGDNVFSTLTNGMFFSGTGHAGIRYSGNTYDDVTNKIADPVNTNTLIDKFYSSTNVLALTGGAATEIITIAVEAGLFSERPTSAFATALADQLIGIYDYDSSTTTSLVFSVTKIDSTVLAAGNRRFGVSATGKGYAKE